MKALFSAFPAGFDALHEQILNRAVAVDLINPRRIVRAIHATDRKRLDSWMNNLSSPLRHVPLPGLSQRDRIGSTYQINYAQLIDRY
ncbi:hypothetical protein [Methylobacter sp. YRD-M1]|uniref:hypothetical protein n=1 Tax=Methylobacter sp. YRD-M1 TaxID=2911520 RepID=UPI00227CDB3C|nr:hypothetical protein [Methylobacter sp. YRD-M1]WAK00543.1 hypothetical protein LZ558_11835 [Methylobacter sp. YRD-M1]